MGKLREIRYHLKHILYHNKDIKLSTMTKEGKALRVRRLELPTEPIAEGKPFDYPPTRLQFDELQKNITYKIEECTRCCIIKITGYIDTDWHEDDISEG